MRIKDIAARTGVPIDTVRHYEKAGLLHAPSRSANGYRRYVTADVDRLCFIRNCRALDMSLPEVRELLDMLDRPRADCSPVDALVAKHLGHVRERIASLRQLERQLSALQRACGDAGPSQKCGIVRSLSSSRSDPAPRGHGVHSR